MRVAVIVVTLLAVTTPADASQSCMSKAEARQHFRSVHIYWHGPNHCWDASSPRHQQAIQARRRTPIHAVQRKSDQPKWRDSMSELLPSDEPAQSLKTQTTLDVDVDNVAAAKPWTERWVDFEPSPIVAHRVRVVQIVPQPAT
jgi:hypothetical protein